jgi:hypothetical protein
LSSNATRAKAGAATTANAAEIAPILLASRIVVLHPKNSAFRLV